MATKPKQAVRQVRTITVEQAVRYLAITNMAVENMLMHARRVSGRFNVTTKGGWKPKDGAEIDDGFDSMRRIVIDDNLWGGIESERRYFQKALRKNIGAYDKTCFDGLNLKVVKSST